MNGSGMGTSVSGGGSGSGVSVVGAIGSAGYMSSVYAHLCCHHRNVHVFLCMCAVHRISVRE